MRAMKSDGKGGWEISRDPEPGVMIWLEDGK
jgi:hypothetical protein